MSLDFFILAAVTELTSAEAQFARGSAHIFTSIPFPVEKLDDGKQRIIECFRSSFGGNLFATHFYMRGRTIAYSRSPLRSDNVFK